MYATDLGKSCAQRMIVREGRLLFFSLTLGLDHRMTLHLLTSLVDWVFGHIGYVLCCILWRTKTQSGIKNGRGDSEGIKRQIKNRKFVKKKKKLNEGKKQQSRNCSTRLGTAKERQRHIWPDRRLTGSRESELKRIVEKRGKNGTRDMRKSRQWQKTERKCMMKTDGGQPD